MEPENEPLISLIEGYSNEDDIYSTDILETSIETKEKYEKLIADFSNSITNSGSNQSNSSWQQLYDPTSQNYYYWNSQTNLVTWTKPYDFIDSFDVDPQIINEEIQTEFPLFDEITLPPGWRRCYDPDKNQYYYWHRNSGKRSWELPEIEKTETFENSPPPSLIEVTDHNNTKKNSKEIEQDKENKENKENIENIENKENNETKENIEKKEGSNKNKESQEITNNFTKQNNIQKDESLSRQINQLATGLKMRIHLLSKQHSSFRVPLSPIQVLLVELEIRLNDWKEGNSTPHFVISKVQNLIHQLNVLDLNPSLPPTPPTPPPPPSPTYTSHVIECPPVLFSQPSSSPKPPTPPLSPGEIEEIDKNNSNINLETFLIEEPPVLIEQIIKEQPSAFNNQNQETICSDNDSTPLSIIKNTKNTKRHAEESVSSQGSNKKIKKRPYLKNKNIDVLVAKWQSFNEGTDQAKNNDNKINSLTNNTNNNPSPLSSNINITLLEDESNLVSSPTSSTTTSTSWRNQILSKLMSSYSE